MKTNANKTASPVRSFDFYDGELKTRKGTKEKKRNRILSNIKSYFNGGNLQESLRMVDEIEGI